MASHELASRFYVIRIAFTSLSFFPCHIHSLRVRCGSARWPGASCSSSSRESRRHGCSRTTGRCSESCSEATVISKYRSLHLGSVPARCSNGIAELVPREPCTAPARVNPQSATGGSADARHLVHKRSLPRRRTHEDVGSLREGTLALRADRWRQPLDPAGRIRPAKSAAHRVVGLMHSQASPFNY